MISTSFNLDRVRHQGSDIFLHVNGRGATAGCVSVPRPVLIDAIRRLDPAYAPVIAIGRQTRCGSTTACNPRCPW